MWHRGGVVRSSEETPVIGGEAKGLPDMAHIEEATVKKKKTG